MAQINCSGHFIHSSRRIAPPPSQICLGTDSFVTPISSARSSSRDGISGNNNNRMPMNAKSLSAKNNNTEAGGGGVPTSLLSASRQARRTQLESAMWTGNENLLSPATRDKIIKQEDNQLLGGCNRRFAGRSNQSNPKDLFLNPGEKSKPSSSSDVDGAASAVDIRCQPRGTRKINGRDSMANSAEFITTTVGKSTAGSVISNSSHSNKNGNSNSNYQTIHGVKRVDHERDHLDNFGYKVRASPIRQRTPPPPLPERKQKYHVRRASNSPHRGNNCSDEWARWGENHVEIRKQGPKMFPERNEQTFGFSTNNNNPADECGTAGSSLNGVPKPGKILHPATTATERKREKEAADELMRSVKDLQDRNKRNIGAGTPVKNSTTTTTTTSRGSGLARPSSRSSSLGDGGVVRAPAVRSSSNGKKVQSNSNNTSANVSGIFSTSSSNQGSTAAYVPRKKVATPTRK